jgi:hypothetical protein
MKKILPLSIIIIILFSFLQFHSAKSFQDTPDPDSPFSGNSSSATLIGIAHGAHIRPAVYYGDEIANFNKLVGKDLALVMYFMDWNTSGLNPGDYFDNWLLRTIQDTFGSNEPAIMLSWQPTSGSTPGCSRSYSNAIPLSDIINGACDNYIRGFAQALKARPERFLIRFAHEMNLAESPWWPANSGGTPAIFVQMWRHVHDVFSSQNVPNVEWVWSPNYESTPADQVNNGRNSYYPGDDYVDWVAVDGYNWGGSNWATFNDVFDSAEFRYVLKDFACRYPKPQIIAETGSVEGGSSGKSQWILDAYQSLKRFPFIRSIVWFNDYAFENPGGADFRVTTGTAASGSVQSLGAWTDAYKQAISDPIFQSTLPSLQYATPPSTYCEDGDPVYSVTPMTTTLELSKDSVHQITGMLFNRSQVLSLRVPAGSNIKGTFSPSMLTAPWGTSALTLEMTPQTPGGEYDLYVQGNGIDLVRIHVTIARTYSISGKVTNGNASPISGASVVLSTGESVKTGSDGIFTFYGLKTGVYNVGLDFPGYTSLPCSHLVSVGPNDVSGQNFMVAALQISHDVGEIGSIFTVTGQGFKANSPATVIINDYVMSSGSIFTDGQGNISFQFGTSEADLGYYVINVQAISEARTDFKLIPGASMWTGSTPAFELQPDIAGSEVYLPNVLLK